MKGKKVFLSLIFCALVSLPVSTPTSAGLKALPQFVWMGDMSYQEPLPGSEALISYIRLDNKTINVGKGQPVVACVLCSVVNLGFSLKRFTVTFSLEVVDPRDGGKFLDTKQIIVGPIWRLKMRLLLVQFVAPEESGTYSYTVRAKLIHPDGERFEQEKTLTLVVQ